MRKALNTYTKDDFIKAIENGELMTHYEHDLRSLPVIGLWAGLMAMIAITWIVDIEAITKSGAFVYSWFWDLTILMMVGAAFMLWLLSKVMLFGHRSRLIEALKNG